MKRVVVCILFLFVLCGCTSDKIYSEVKNYDRILYSWHLDSINNDRENFNNILKEYDINVIYQCFKDKFFEDKDDSFIKEMNDRNIKVYHLGGDPSWGSDGGFLKIKLQVDNVLEFNKTANYKIDGIVLDIEPYVSEKNEEMRVVDFEIYAEEIIKAYQYIRENDLEMVLAIPYWFERIDYDLFEEVIKNSDTISVMNYNINRTSDNIKEEIEVAKKYNKKINTIYEVNYEDQGYFKSYDSILRDFKRIKDENDCENLSISYHHYDSM